MVKRFCSPPLEGTSSENPSHACRQKLVIWLCSLCLLQSFGISVLMSMLRSYHEDLENEIEEFKCHGKRETILWLCDYEVLQSWCPTRMCGIQSAFEFTKSLGPWEYILGRFEARPPWPHFSRSVLKMTDIDRDGKVSYNELLRQNFKKTISYTVRWMQLKSLWPAPGWPRLCKKS